MFFVYIFHYRIPLHYIWHIRRKSLSNPSKIVKKIAFWHPKYSNVACNHLAGLTTYNHATSCWLVSTVSKAMRSQQYNRYFWEDIVNFNPKLEKLINVFQSILRCGSKIKTMFKTIIEWRSLSNLMHVYTTFFLLTSYWWIGKENWHEGIS